MNKKILILNILAIVSIWSSVVFGKIQDMPVAWMNTNTRPEMVNRDIIMKNQWFINDTWVKTNIKAEQYSHRKYLSWSANTGINIWIVKKIDVKKKINNKKTNNKKIIKK